MFTLRLFLTLGYLFCCFDGKKTFHFFFQEKSSLRSFVKKSLLKCFLTAKQVLFEVSEKKLEMNGSEKKSGNAFGNLEKKVFLKLVESLSDIHMTHANTTIHF